MVCVLRAVVLLDIRYAFVQQLKLTLDTGAGA